MDNVVDIGVLVKHLIQSGFIRDVDLVKDRSFATDEFDAVDDLFRGVIEIVDDDDLVVSFEQRKSGE